MDLHDAQAHLNEWLQEASVTFQKVPGSAVLIRYVRSSYQNDPVRSAIELVLVIFFIRYLMAPSYSTSKQNYVKLTEDVSARGTDRERETQVGGPRRPLTLGIDDRKSTNWLRNGPPSRLSPPRPPRRRPSRTGCP